MPDIKEYSTGRLGNKWPEHPNSDHVNTKGLDKEGIPGLEAYIDEDIVRAFDDNRPLINLLTNDQISSDALDYQGKSLGINAYFKNSKSDWKLSIGKLGYYVDPEDFSKQVITTPLNVNIGYAVAPNRGTVVGSHKVIKGFERSDGTVLWIDPHDWYYDNTILVDDPHESYEGYYRAIYSDVSRSSIPENYEEYEITIRQRYTTGAVYKYSIYIDKDFLVPLKSSVFNVSNKEVSFTSEDVRYPGYNHYPACFDTLTTQGFGVLEVGKDTIIKKYNRKEEYKILADRFNAEAGSYKAPFEADVFRENISANVNRIENDVNFVRVINGISEYNDTAKVYFSAHKTETDAILPLYDNRNFLGNSTYSFSLAINEGPFKTIELTAPETRAYQDLNLSKTTPYETVPTSGSISVSFNISINNDSPVFPGDYTNIPVTIENPTLYELRDIINASLIANNVYAEARIAKKTNYDLRIFSKSSGNYSVVDIQPSSSDLADNLGTTYSAPVNGQSEWYILPDTYTTSQEFYAEVSSGVIQHNDFGADPQCVGNQIFQSMFDQGFDNYTVGLTTVLGDNHVTELYIKSNNALQGYKELNMSVPLPSKESGLQQLTTYYFRLAIDEGDFEEFSFATSTDTTYSGVISVINTVLDGKAEMTIMPNNDIRITSDSFGSQAFIDTADGISGTSLFGFGYPAAGFTPINIHKNSIRGSGDVIKIRDRQINTFSIFTDLVKERLIFSHTDKYLYITPDTKLDHRDAIDTEHAFKTKSTVGDPQSRWSTHNDKVFRHDMANHTDWLSGAYITKIFTARFNLTDYLLVGNSEGQIFFIDNSINLYEPHFDISHFTMLTDANLANGEKVNNFFIYNEAQSEIDFLFVMTDTHILHTDATSGIDPGLTFTDVDANSSLNVPNLYAPLFSEIRDAEQWNANINLSTTNQYLVFVGDSEDASNWPHAPILYAIFDLSTTTFDWYAEETYKKQQIDDIGGIKKFSGWQDPSQNFQLFITNNAKGPEIWTSNTQNNDTDLGSPGDDRFNRFSWVESNYENGPNHLEVDDELSRFTFIEAFDDKLFIGGIRKNEDFVGGLYSYAFNKLKNRYKIDAHNALYDKFNDKLYFISTEGTVTNTSPAISVLSTEKDEGRAQIFSNKGLNTTSSWPIDSTFRVILNGFSLGGINFDGEFNIQFDGSSTSNLQDIADRINGASGGGFSAAKDAETGIESDLTPAIRARAITSYVKVGNNYNPEYKIVIESKIPEDSGSGHATTRESTKSNCSIKMLHPTIGTTVIGTGNDTMEIDSETTGYANLRLIDWPSGECYQLKRVTTSELSFSGSTFMTLDNFIDTDYNILSGSIRVRTNEDDELGFSNGRGKILKNDTSTGLANNSTEYVLKVTFEDNKLPAGLTEITEITIPADSSSSLDSKYWLLYGPRTYSIYDEFYVWYNVDYLSDDPMLTGKYSIEVLISENDTAEVVAELTAEALNELLDFNVTVASDVITITNNDVGDVTDASDVDAGVTVNVIQQGEDSGKVVDWITITGSSAQTIADLLVEINNDLTGGTASLNTIGGTSEYCDIKFTSNTIGDDSSVKIEESIHDINGNNLLGLKALDLIPNVPINGSTALNTAGSQTIGFSWENTDYFLVPSHPDTSETRIYIPNGDTRIDPGATVWVDYWEWRKLIKIPAKDAFGQKNTPSAGEWTYDVEQKKVALGEKPNKGYPSDIIYVDANVEKDLLTLDLSDNLPVDQTELSNRFYNTLPRNISNSEIVLARALARITPLHYGVKLWSTDNVEHSGITAQYSFFLPRVDSIIAKKDADYYGNRAKINKGTPESRTPYIEFRTQDQDEEVFVYSTYINSEDYHNNKIIQAPWYNSNSIENGKLYLSGDLHHFKPEKELISTKGLKPLRDEIKISKLVEKNDYSLVNVTDPLGTWYSLRRDTYVDNIDYSNTIFVDKANGNDVNDGYTENSPKETLQDAVANTSSSRPNVVILPTQDKTVPVFEEITVNKNFKVKIFAKESATIRGIYVIGPLYLEGINIDGLESDGLTPANIVLVNNVDFQAKYCFIRSIIASSSVKETGINLKIENSIVKYEAISIVDDGSNSLSINGPINVEFSHVYVKESPTLLKFEPEAYDTTVRNKFIFNHVTNSFTAANGYVVDTSKETNIFVNINNSLLVTGTETQFASATTIVINESLSYVMSNNETYGTGSLLTNNSKNVNPGDIDIILELGASVSKARGYSKDSLAINYIDNDTDAGAFIEERVKNAIKDNESSSKEKSFLVFDEDRVLYRANLEPERFSFYLRFKPLANFQQRGVLFDSRYDRDYMPQSSAFNLNGNDFIQIVYDNNSYGLNYLKSNQYCFKLIISNNSTTEVLVIGPRFTVDNYFEYDKWHEIGVLLFYSKTYNPKYDDIDFISEYDKSRHQTTVYTTFDGYIDKTYVLKTVPYIGSAGSILPNSKWKPGSILSRYFNIGGGWTSSWVTTVTGRSWSTWTPSYYNMLVDDFLVGSDILPLNALKEFNRLEKIQLEENDYRDSLKDNKHSLLVTHCNNSHPYSENGMEPFENYYVSFKPYEGMEHNALAIERVSNNLVPYGHIEKGKWFDRATDTVTFNSNDIDILATATGPELNTFIVIYNYSSESRLDVVNYIDGSIISADILLASDTASEVVVKQISNSYVILYTRSSDSKLYYTKFDKSTYSFSGEVLVNNAVTDSIDFVRAHSDTEIAIVYHSSSLGYIQTRSLTSHGNLILGPNEFGDGHNVLYPAIAETIDKDGNNTYTIFYRDMTNDTLRFVMYGEDTSSVVLSHDTLISGQQPVAVESFSLPNNNIFVKWKDFNTGTNSPVKIAILSPDAADIVEETDVFLTTDGSLYSEDTLLLKDGSFLFALKDRLTQNVYFKLYSQEGAELSTSPYLRETGQELAKVFTVYSHQTDNVALISNYDNTGIILELDSYVPTRWYKDYTGIYDQYVAEVFNSKTYYGQALHIVFDHSTSLGETGIFVADAESNDLTAFDSNNQTNGIITTELSSALHGSYGYTFKYDNSGNTLFANSNFSTTDQDVCSRFYFRLDQYFSLNGSGDRLFEITQFGPSSDPVIISLEFSDPAIGGDGRFRLKAETTSYSSETTTTTVVNYDVDNYIEVRWKNDTTDGGWEVWLNGVSTFSHLSQDTTSEGNVDFIQIGSNSGSAPTTDSKIYFDDVRVDTDYIGMYTAGLGQGIVWTNSSITQATENHYMSGYYYMISGDWILELDGPALEDPIKIQFSENGVYYHETFNRDSVFEIKTEPIKWNSIFRFSVGLVPDYNDNLEVKVKSVNSDDDLRIDEFLVDNLKLEQNEYASSIEANAEGYIGYPVGLKNRGSAFLRLQPEFAFNSDIHHTIFAGAAWSTSGSYYISHELYYDKDDRKFKFYVANDYGDIAMVESDEYGPAITSNVISDLNERHTIVCNWDIIEEVYELTIDNYTYRLENVSIPNFKNSVYTKVGNYETLGRAADSLFDLIRISEEPLTHDEISLMMAKNDPFVRSNETNFGNVTVKSLSFFGLHESDEATIYGEHIGETSHLVLDIHDDFEDKVIIRHLNKNLAEFGAGGLHVNGVLSAQTMSFTATATMSSYDDHITLRFGFSGTPPTYNDGYLEVERGSLINSEIRWDESQDSWVIHDGTDNYISIDGTHIGTWRDNNNFNLVSNGIGAITFSTESETNTGEQNRTDGTERFRITPTESVINELGINHDFRVEALSGTTARVRESTHLMYTDADNKQVLFGRNDTSGSSGTIVVNFKSSMQSDNTGQFGIIEFLNNDGLRSGYIGDGNGSNTWQIISEVKTLSLEGQDFDINLTSTDTDSFNLVSSGGMYVDLTCSTYDSFQLNTQGGVQWNLDGTEAGDRYVINIASSNPASYQVHTAGGLLFDLNGTDSDDKFKVEVASTNTTSFHVDTLGGATFDVDNGFYVYENTVGAYYHLDTDGNFKVHTNSTDVQSIHFDTLGGYVADVAGNYDINVDSGVFIDENSGSYFHIDTVGFVDLNSVNGILINETVGSYYEIDSSGRITNHSLSGSDIIQYTDGRITIENGGNASATITINATGTGSGIDSEVSTGGYFFNAIGGRFDLEVDEGFRLEENSGGYLDISGSGYSLLHGVNAVRMSENSGSYIDIANNGYFSLYSVNAVKVSENSGSYLNIADNGYTRLYSVNSIKIDESNGASIDLATDLTLTVTNTANRIINNSQGGITLNAIASDVLISADDSINLTENSGSNFAINSGGYIDLNSVNGFRLEETDNGSYLDISNTGTVTLHSSNGLTISEPNSINLNATTVYTNNDFSIDGVLFHQDSVNPTGSTRLNMDGYFYATRVYNAVYNDLAEFIEKDSNFTAEPGDVLVMTDNGLRPSYIKYDKRVIGIYSDSYGYALGASNSDSKYPVAISGRVKVKMSEPCEIGDLLAAGKKGEAIVSNDYKAGKIIGKTLESKKDYSQEKIEIIVMLV